MSHYRGVFIAPSTINKRAHRRSKTYPHSRQQQYKTELSHLPTGGNLSSLFSQRAPKIEGLLKRVTLRFRTGEKRETSTCELQCSSFGSSAIRNKLERKSLDSTDTTDAGNVSLSRFEDFETPAKDFSDTKGALSDLKSLELSEYNNTAKRSQKEDSPHSTENVKSFGEDFIDGKRYTAPRLELQGSPQISGITEDLQGVRRLTSFQGSESVEADTLENHQEVNSLSVAGDDNQNIIHKSQVESPRKGISVVLTKSKRKTQSHLLEEGGSSVEVHCKSHQYHLDLEDSNTYTDSTLNPRKETNLPSAKVSCIIYDFSDGAEHPEIDSHKVDDSQCGVPDTDFRILPKIPNQSKNKTKDRLFSVEKKVLKFGKTVYPEGFDSNTLGLEIEHDDLSSDRVKSRLIAPNYQSASQLEDELIREHYPYHTSTSKVYTKDSNIEEFAEEHQSFNTEDFAANERHRLEQIFDNRPNTTVSQSVEFEQGIPKYYCRVDNKNNHQNLENLYSTEKLSEIQTEAFISTDIANQRSVQSDQQSHEGPEQEVKQQSCDAENQFPNTNQKEVETVCELSEVESLSELAEESTVIPIKPTVILENTDVKPFNRSELVTLHQPPTYHATIRTFPCIRDNQKLFGKTTSPVETNRKEEAGYGELTCDVIPCKRDKAETNRQINLPVRGISCEPRSPTFSITISNFPDSNNKAVVNRQSIENRNTFVEEEEEGSPFSENSEEPCISTPHTPIVFNFETEDVQYFDFTERSTVLSSRNSPIETANNSGHVTPRSFSESLLEDFNSRDFVVSPNRVTSTPALRIETAARRLLYDTEDIQNNSHFKSDKEFCGEKENIAELDSEETKMASLPTQNVKAKKELLESREKVRQLEEKLLNEQKASENKERTIKTLTKELKSFKNRDNKDSNNNENVEELKSKVTTLETDNRILANQVQMVEEANKKLYKELYDTKTQLRFQERRSDDVGAQNTQISRRISQILQSSMDKSTGFTVFLHQMETDLISTDSVLRKLRAQRQALEEVLKSEDEKFQTLRFSPLDKQQKFLPEEAKNAIRSQFEISLEYEFQDEESKQLHCDKRMTELEDIVNESIMAKLDKENEKVAIHQKKIDLARAHVKAVKDIEIKFYNIKERSEKQIATMKDRISSDVKEISKEISSTYLAKQERKGKPKRKSSTLESPDVIRKKSVEEMACFDRTMRSMKSKSQVTRQELSENEKEILSLNEKMRETLNDKIQMSEELLETQSNIQELENRYAEKQRESESLEKELSAKRHAITEMAKEMQEALSHITSDNDESADSQLTLENNQLPEATEKEVQVDDLKDELMQTIILLQTEQKDREEAIRMNEDLFLELENREQEISGLVMELERHKDKEKTKEANSNACKKLKEMINSVEHLKMKADLEQLQNDLEEEMFASEKEIQTLQSELAKQQKDTESLIVLVDYYKDEMALLQTSSEKNSEDASAKVEVPDEQNDEHADKNLSLVASSKEEFSLDTVKQLQEDVLDLQKALESESDVNRNSKEKLAVLEDSLQKEKQAKEYAYRRNRELEDELRIKDLKLNNLASTVATSQSDKRTEKEQNSPVTTISELRSAMAKIQSEKNNLSREVDHLAIDMEESGNYLENPSPEMLSNHKAKSSDVFQSEKRSIFSEADSKGMQGRTSIDSPLVHLSMEKDKIVNELEKTIKTLENEVQSLRSENTLLENEAVDILDDGLKVENKILRNQIKSLANEIAIARADEDDMKREFEHVEIRYHEMQEELNRLSSEKNEQENKIENLSFQNKILSQELELLRNKMGALEEERKIIADEAVGIDVVDNKAFIKENEDLRTDIAKITLDLNVNKEEVERLQNELKISEGTVRDLEMTLTSLQKEKASLEIQVDDLNFLNKTHEKEVNLLKKKIGVLEQEIHVIEQDLAQRSEEVKAKVHVIQNIEKDNATKEVEKQELEKKVKEKEMEFEKTKIAEEKQRKELLEKNCELQTQLKTLEMDSSESKQEQQRLERDLNELRDRLRDADRRFTSTKDDKIKTENSLGSMKNRVGQLQNELSEARAELREKNETIRKLNLKNSELQISLAEKEEELRREERLRMDNMKALDALKMKMERMETDDKKQRDRLFSLKSACSEANEAYEIVKNQNLNLRNEMQDLKKKFAERDVQAESNKREKEKLEEQILNASRTIDDMRKYAVARDQSLSPDSALGISVTSLTELGSGPNSPNSECSDNLFNSGEEELKFMPQEQGLLCKMPTMIENFRAVVRDNELMKTKIVEIMNNKDKMNSQLQYYSTLSDDLQKEVGDKDRFLSELQTKAKMMEDELNDTKMNLAKVERDFASTASEADLVKTTLKVREDTVNELREKVELLEEKEKALELYSKSMSEKYHHEACQKSDAETANKNLKEKNEEQKQLLENLEQKLSVYSSRPRRVSEPDVKVLTVPLQPVVTKKATDITMATLEGKLESIVEYSEVLESSLMDVEMGYRNIQAENERLKREMIDKKEYENLKLCLEEQDKSYKEQEGDLRRTIGDLQEQLSHLESQNIEKEDAMQTARNNQSALLKDFNKLKENFSPLEEANALLKADLESLKEESKQAEELRVKLDTDLKLLKTKMREMEMTAEAYKEENSRLRSDIIALSEEKCEVECRVSEAERREKRLNDLINQERAERQELKQEHESTLSTCDTLQSDLAKARELITNLEAVQNKTEQTNNEMELRLGDITTLKGSLEDELHLARKNIQDLEDRFKKAVDQEEILKQKLNKLGLEYSRLTNVCEQSQKRKSDLERDVVEANGKNEDLEAEIEKIRIEKAGLLKEIAQKEETLESMETKKSELEEERQKLTNDLYLSTKKVLSLQLNLESLRNDVTQLGKELRRLVLGSIGREARDEAEEKTMETDLEMSLFENEVVIQALRQTIKSTERSLDMIRPEAKISELENKLCQKDIDSVHREFAFLKDQLGSFRHSCQKLSDETKRLKEDVNNKDAVLQDTREKLETSNEENIENKDKVLQLQSKCNGLEILTAEYEQNAETTTNDMIRANQTIATLEATITKQEQKKTALEKERLVLQERLNNLENNQRASKDEMRNDKKRIASLEVESSEKLGLARELEKIETNFNELKLKYEDALKEREEVKAELVAVREEIRLAEVELKNTKKDADNFKKHIVIEREMRQRVEQDLNEHIEELKTCKKNLNTLQRSQSKLEDDNESLQEKGKLLEEAGQTFKKQLEVQSVEMKRLKESLTDTRNELLSTNEKLENTEKERKRLLEDLVHSEEQAKKLQDACSELLREKMFATEKVGSLSETLDAMISSHEYALNNLKQDLRGSNKDLSITKSSLERSQKRNEELLDEIKNHESKIKAMDEKKQELLEKYWESQSQLSEAQSCMDSLRAETKELKGRVALHLSKIEQLEDTLKREHEESENTIVSLNGKISSLKTQGNTLFQEKDVLQNSLETTEESLSKTTEELKQTEKTLTEKEKFYTTEVAKRDQTIDSLKIISEAQRADLKKTKDILRDVSRENVDLKERLGTTERALDILETKVSDQENTNVDALAEAQAKLKVVSKMKASNSGENFVELQSAPLLSAELESFDSIDGPLESGRDASIKEVVDAFHQTCMVSFSDNRELQDKLSKANESNAILEDSLNKERNIMTETKRYLHELERKKSKLEEEVKRLRHRLEIFKQKSIELERSKDDELCELKGEKVILDKENWVLKEAVEELKAKSKETESERDRYAEEVLVTQKQVVEARADIKHAQDQIDSMQEQLLDMKKRTFELEAREKSLQQKIAEKEKELYASEMKTQELEKLYNNANEKKTELYAQMSKAEDKIRQQENESDENHTKSKEMDQEIHTLKNKVAQLEADLGESNEEVVEAKDKIDELEIQRGSLQATNEILKHQLELSRSENEALTKSYTTTHDESLNLSKALNEVTINKGNLQTEIKCLSQEKERLQDALTASESQLRESEDNLVKAFQESENLKRQMLKVQSTACAESVKLQGEFAKLRSELDSIKKEAIEKDKEYIEKVTKLKCVEKENDGLKKELNDIHIRESELKLDYTTTNSKLQSYVLERECWEREVKTVLGEIEQQKNVNATKEHRLERLRMRYEQEIGFLSQRVSSLERELKVVQDAAEQQRHADEIAHKLHIEAKDMEIDNLRMRLQATRIHTSDKNVVVDQMKNQLDERTSQINDLMSQMSLLKDSYNLELASVQADLKCSQMENLLKLRKDMECDNQLSSSQDSVSDLLDAIKSSRKESERLRHLLGSRMRQMSTLNRDINSKRSSLPAGTRSYGLYSRDNEGHLRD